MSSTNTDIAIVGGGMVGAAAALSLAQAGYQVTLLDARHPPLEWDESSHDLRVSALTLTSCKMLDALGVWDDIRSLGACPFQQMHVWDANSSGLLQLDSADCGFPEMGFVVENRVTVAALWRALAAHPRVTLLCPAELHNFEAHSDGIELLLQDGSSVQAALLIGADGSRSQVRDLAGITTHGWGYDQKALVATVRPQQPHQFTAWQRFLDEGPLALLPLNDNLISIVWTAATATTESRLALSDDAFCEALEDASESMLGSFELLGPRAAFPLQLQFSPTYISDRLALVGDAIHTIHPLAGQGANLGLADVATLTSVLSDALKQGRNPASRQTLRRFERARKADNLVMMAAMDGLKRIYGNQAMPTQWVRSNGMQLINQSSPLKHWIARYAMGLSGQHPRYNPEQSL